MKNMKTICRLTFLDVEAIMVIDEEIPVNSTCFGRKWK